MITEDDGDAVFHALAHQTRRMILDLLVAEPGRGVGEVAAMFDVSRIAIMNHLSVLEKARLITSVKEGRTRRLYFNAVPLRMIQERWIDSYTSELAGRLTTLKHLAENDKKLRGSKNERRKTAKPSNP